MFGRIYNHGTIRKYVIYFGSLFNQVYLTRDNKDGSRAQTTLVPINYAPKEKYLARLDGNPKLDRSIAIQLPRMAFEMININYDPERKLMNNGIVRTPDPNDPNAFVTQANPVPYDLTFNLYVLVKNAEDGTRIIEQILPFFAPQFNATIDLNPDVDCSYDIPTVLNSVMQEDTYEGSFMDRRAIVWTLTFTLKAWLFGPTSKRGDIIKQVEVNFKIPDQQTSDVNMIIKPGLTEDGEPTSNPDESIDKSLIKATDNYGYIIEFGEDIYD